MNIEEDDVGPVIGKADQRIVVRFSHKNFIVGPGFFEQQSKTIDKHVAIVNQ